MQYAKRLIEVDLPIKRISAHARREKSIKPGHISTLHIWWARRPLAACRAVICAALWPDPVDPLCPDPFRVAARHLMEKWASDHLKLCGEESGRNFIAIQKDLHLLKDNAILRRALLDFIADFANWDNSTVKEYVDTSRALTQAAHEALGGATGTKPFVVDSFAGGGSIPLEALRVGADAFASDLNPVAVLLNKVVLEYIPKYGQRLADEVRKWGDWIKREAEKELAQFYPKDPDGATPIAYLWARTIQCEGPGCGVEVPLIRNMQITREDRQWHFSIDSTKKGKLEVSVAEGSAAKERPTVASGSVTCPQCSYTTSAKAVRAQLVKQNGGANNSRLLAVYVQSPRGRYFRASNSTDRRAVQLATEKLDKNALPREEINPIRPYKNTRGLSAVTRIGIRYFRDLYTYRQALAIHVFQNILLRLVNSEVGPELREAVLSVLRKV